MTDDFSPPPIASPHGAGIVVSESQQEPDSIRIDVVLGFKPACRYALIEWLTPTMAGMVAMILLLLVLGAITNELLSVLTIVVPAIAFLSTFIRLFSKRRFTIQISFLGLRRPHPHHNHPPFFRWSQFIWIIERGGDLWLASLWGGFFIPREVFTSRAQSHEFTLLLRELKRSKGASWQEEWNGSVLGVRNE